MKKPHQENSIRGSDNPIVSQEAYNGNISQAVINKLEQEMQGIDFGGVSLIITFRNGYPTFRIEKTISMMTATTGSDQ